MNKDDSNPLCDAGVEVLLGIARAQEQKLDCLEQTIINLAFLMGNTMEKKKLKAKGKKGRSKWIKKDFDRAIFVVAKGLHFEIYVKFTNEPHILLAEVCSRIEFWAFIVECILLLYLFVGQRYLLTKNFLYDRLQFSVLFTTVAHLWKLTSKTLVSDLSFFLHCWCWNLLLCFSSSRWDFHPFIDKLKKYEGTSIHFHAICSWH